MKTISLKWIIRWVFVILLCGISTYTYTSVFGPPAGLTGAPTENNCTSCHSGSPVTSGTAFDGITLTGLPAGGYIPGSTYTLTLSGGGASTLKNGYQLTALTAAGAMAGSFTAGTGSQTMIGGSRNYVGHTSSGITGTWSFSWTAPATASGQITFYLAFNATNSSNNTLGDLVYLKTFSVGPGNLPLASIVSPSNNTIVCLGDSVQFQGSATNSPTSFAWQFLGNLPSSSSVQNPKVLFTQAGFTTVRLTATNSSGTSAAVSISIQVVAKPAATITTPQGPVVCGNDSVSLNGNTGTGLSYLWTPGNQTTSSIKVGSTGTYSLKVTNSQGCFRVSSPVNITQVAKPSMNVLTSADSACVSDSVLITGSSGFSAYGFYRDSLFLSSSSVPSKKFLLPAGTWQLGVVGFNGTCYSNKAQKLVQVIDKLPAPSAVCGPATSNSVVYDILESGAVQVSLDNGVNWISPNNGMAHFVSGLTPNQSVTMLMRWVTPMPCPYSYIGTKTCVANPCQPITYTVNYPASNCLPGLSDSVAVEVKISNPGSASLLHSFDNRPYTTAQSFTYYVKSGVRQVHLKTVDSLFTSCGIKDSVLTFNGVFPLTTAPVIQPSVTTACDNGVFGSLLSSKPPLGYEYRWYLNGDTVPIAIRNKNAPELPFLPVASYGIKNGDQLSVVVLDSLYGCSRRSAPVTIKVVKPLPVGFTWVKQNLQLEVTDTNSYSLNRSWSFGDSTLLLNTTRTLLHTYGKAGSFQVVLTIRDTNGCYNADTQTVNIVSTGLNSLNQEALNIYPNPSNGRFVLHWQGLQQQANMQLYDMQGRILLERKVSCDTPVDLSEQGIPSGQYFIRLSISDQGIWLPLFLQQP